MGNRYAVEVEIESYASSGRLAIEWALNELIEGSRKRLKVHVTRLTEDGKPDLGVRSSAYMVDLVMKDVRRVRGTP